MRMPTACGGALRSCSKWALRPWSLRPASLCANRRLSGFVCAPIASSPSPKPRRPGLRQLSRTVPAERPYFLFVGTLEPRKNLSTLLDAWREVRREHEVDLLIAGRRRVDAPAIAPEPGCNCLVKFPTSGSPRSIPALWHSFTRHYTKASDCPSWKRCNVERP